MPVGEGSIRRAAGRAKTEAGKKITEDERTIEMRETEKHETKKSEMKKPGTKKPEARNTVSEKKRKSSGKEKECGTKTEGTAEKEKDSGENIYEAYGIGQPLPMYLL